METPVYGNSTTGLSTGTGEGTLNKLSSSAHDAVDSAANTVASTADEAARRVKPKIDKVAAMAHEAVDKAAGAAANTADKLTARGESLNEAQKKLVADACSYVSANPLKSVGFAVLAGFLLARIVL